MAHTDADRVRSAYLRYLDAGNQMLRPRGSAALSPGTTLVEDEEVQVHPDENLKTVYSRHLNLRIKGAYRVSGSIVRGFYLNDDVWMNPEESRILESYEIFARRIPSDRAQTGVTPDDAWSIIERAQRQPKDYHTGSLLPTSMVFPKALPLSPDPAKTNLGVAINRSPLAMRGFIDTGKLKIKVDRERSDIWTQIDPHVNARLDHKNIWQVAREVRLKLEMGGDTYIVCSQIARLPDGTYVPWKKTEEYRLAREGYHGYNFTGPYEPPSLISGDGLPSRGGGTPPLHLPPPPPDHHFKVVNYNIPPPPPFDAHGNLVPLPWLPSARVSTAPPHSRQNPPGYGPPPPLPPLPPPPPPTIDPRTGQLCFPQIHEDRARRDPSRHSPQCPLPPARLPDARPNSYNIPLGLAPPPPPPSNLDPYISDPASPVNQIDNLLAGAS